MSGVVDQLLLSYTQLFHLLEEYTGPKFRRFIFSFRDESEIVPNSNSISAQIACLPNGLFELLVTQPGTRQNLQQVGLVVVLRNGRLSQYQSAVFTELLDQLEQKALHRGYSIENVVSQVISQASRERILSHLKAMLETSPSAVTQEKKALEPFPLSEPDWVQISRARSLLYRLENSSLDRQAGQTQIIQPAIGGSRASSMRALDRTSSFAASHRSRTKESYTMCQDNSRSTGFFSRPPKLSPARLANLKKHVVNLNRGRFSTDGTFTSTKLSMQAIFDRHIPEWMESQNKEHLDLVLYSHGGLTSEAWGLAAADKQVDWWKKNGVYPVFFVWETGLMETLWQMFQANWTDAPRGWLDGIAEAFGDLNDGIWEQLFRVGQGPTVWGGMKSSARLAFDEDSEGDGVEFLDSLIDFVNGFDNDVRLHAVGHSAGSIFLSQAIAAAHRIYEEYPKFETVHFLAPAITTQLFRQTLMPLIGRGETDQAKHLSVFTMDDSYEKDDTVGPYRKSLLYLIHHALEPEKETHLVGLEHSLTSESDMSDFFGLTGPRSQLTDVVYSVTPGRGSRKNRSESETHGGFDDDPATMESVCRRIIDSDDDDGFVPFPQAKGIDPTQLPRTADRRSNRATCGRQEQRSVRQRPPGRSRTNGSRAALCIGINDYDVKPLSGCENDARRWSGLFESLGFSVELLLSADATRANLVQSIESLIANANNGDVIAIQYAGHGTKVPDENGGDESGGDTPGHDEALVPIDYGNDGLLLDDDLGELCRTIANGVNVTFFFDCCHSGTATRMFMSTDSNNGTSRFLPSTPAMIEENRRARERRGISRSGFNPYTGRREILFAACKSGEVAWESGGSGDFTGHAMNIFDQHGSDLTCAEFQRLILQEFGMSPRQTPGLWCDPDLESTLLLGGGRAAVETAGGGSGSLSDRLGLVADLKRILDRYSY